MKLLSWAVIICNLIAIYTLGLMSHGTFRAHEIDALNAINIWLVSHPYQTYTFVFWGLALFSFLWGKVEALSFILLCIVYIYSGVEISPPSKYEMLKSLPYTAAYVR